MVKQSICKVGILAAALAFCAAAVAQAPTAYKPGDVIKFTVKFSGPDIEKISQLQVNFGSTTGVPDDQQGFVNYWNAGDTRKIGPDTFEVSGTIQPNNASGTYTIRQIAAGDPRLLGGLIFVYTSELPRLLIQIDNPSRLKKPELKSIEKTP